MKPTRILPVIALFIVIAVVAVGASLAGDKEKEMSHED